MGGEITRIDKTPYQVSIQDTEGHFCGGTLIDSTTILTAAHCLDGRNIESVSIVMGTNDLENVHLGQTRQVTEIILHPSFDAYSLENDIAIAKLASPAELSKNCQPVSVALPSDENAGWAQAGETALVSGWGKWKEDEYPYPRYLQSAEVVIISNETANSSAVYDGQISQTNVVAGFLTGGIDACDGDSGGPLMFETQYGTQILGGIVSWGEGCAQPNKPGVYTRVSAYSEWIYSVIAPFPDKITVLQNGSLNIPTIARVALSPGQSIEWTLSSSNGDVVANGDTETFAFQTQEPGTYMLSCITTNVVSSKLLEVSVNVYEYANCNYALLETPTQMGPSTALNMSDEATIGVSQHYRVPNKSMLEIQTISVSFAELEIEENSDSRIYLDIYSPNGNLLTDFDNSFFTLNHSSTSSHNVVLELAKPIPVTDSFGIELWHDDFTYSGELISFETVSSHNTFDASAIDVENTSHPLDKLGYAINPIGCLYSNSNLISNIQPKAPADKLRLFPNPALHYIEVTVPADCEMQIASSLGVLVLIRNLKAGTNHLNVSKLSTGYYLCTSIFGSIAFTKE